MNLKDLLPEALWTQVNAAIEAHNNKEGNKAVKFVDLSDGGYVSVDKFNDKTATLQTQVDALNATIKQRDTDLEDVRNQLKTAGEDKDKLAQTQASLEALQGKYDQAKQEFEAQLQAQTYASLVKEKASALTFTSTAARKEFIREATAKEFKVDGENLLGYGDWLKEYQAADPGAFTQPGGENNKPRVPQGTGPTNQPGGKGQTLSLAEMMQRANTDPTYKPNFK